MRAEIITIGDELCRGDVVNTNASWLAGELWNLDVMVTWMTSCRDDDADVKQAFGLATERADLIVVSGGLGPTEDDKTVSIISELLDVEPMMDPSALAAIERRFTELGYPLTDSHKRQALVPGGSQVCHNPVGLAPGFEVLLNTVPVFCMPGVPAEMREIFLGSVREKVISIRAARGEKIVCIARRSLRVFGVGESQVASLLEGLIDELPGTSLHYRVPFPEVLVQIVVRDREQSAADSRLQSALGGARERLGWRVYGEQDDSLAAVLGQALQQRGATMVTAESCTGGMIGSLMTDIAGSSSYFLGGAITYSNAEKMRQLDVPASVLEQHGAVSEACVEAMAAGARKRFGADFAVAISGVAGPGGGSPDRPVGTVWLAVAGPDGVFAKRRRWSGARHKVRRLAAFWAMAATLRAVNESASDGGRS